ncbi:MAG TPA: DNA-processing protein DprA [Burkholderiaceae bacterium]|nr:DNA-processing protein DprA [Burkholderiaceae bacterium]
MTDRDELRAWLHLLEAPGLGRDSARRLLGAFGSPQAVIEAPAAARREVVGAPAASLANEPPRLAALLDATLAWLDAAEAEAPRAVIALGDPAYPAALLDAPDPPLLLYVRGRLEILNADAIAVVGSRNPTPQGAQNAQAFASHLSHAGFAIVSGMALGIDAAAHLGGLEGAGGTIAVVGTGLDLVYPRRHAALAQRIAAHGAIVSEYALGTPALAPHFPQRNRLIAGLARGTLVVEAALQSGSLITARLANEAGREVFAIPGSIHSPQSRGCHALIRQGAKLVETAQDILEELRPQRPAMARAAPESQASGDPLLAALGFDPVTLDALAARTGRSAAELSGRLLELELDGQVARLPGQLFQRVAPR